MERRKLEKSWSFVTFLSMSARLNDKSGGNKSKPEKNSQFFRSERSFRRLKVVLKHEKSQRNYDFIGRKNLIMEMFESSRKYGVRNYKVLQKK